MNNIGDLTSLISNRCKLAIDEIIKRNGGVLPPVDKNETKKYLLDLVSDICGVPKNNLLCKKEINLVAAWASKDHSICSGYNINPNKGLYIFGHSFYGKTTVIKALKRTSLYSKMKIFECSELHTLATKDIQVMEDVTNYDICAFDDLGAEPLTIYGNPFMESIILTLFKKDKPFIFTSNLPPYDINGTNMLLNRYGERVYNRINSKCNFIRFGGAKQQMPTPIIINNV